MIAGKCTALVLFFDSPFITIQQEKRLAPNGSGLSLEISIRLSYFRSMLEKFKQRLIGRAQLYCFVDKLYTIEYCPFMRYLDLVDLSLTALGRHELITNSFWSVSLILGNLIIDPIDL